MTREASVLLVYLKDINKFRFQEGGQAVTQQTALERVMAKYPERFKKESEALAYLEQVMIEASTTSIEMKQKKNEEAAINWQAMYERVSPIIPLAFSITGTADKLLYTVSDKNEVRKLNFKTKEDAINAIQGDTEAWRKLKGIYLSCSELEMHRHKLSFADWVKKITYDYLLLDENKQIAQNDIERLSWDNEGYAFKKFDPSQIAEGPTPTWDEFLERLDYPEIFMAWVWSIFEPSNNIRQVMWLVGDGIDGKSAAQNALAHVLGFEYVKAMQRGEINEKFFLSSVFGKVLVNYADSEDIYLITHPKLKQITGGDTASIEFKSKDSFSGDVYCKIFITSNKNPKINPESRAQISRLIRLDVAKAKNNDSKFEQRLIAEIWQFLWKCKENYLKHVSEGHNSLILPPDLIEKMSNVCASESYSLMKDFIYNCMDLGPNYVCKLSDFKLALREFSAQQHLESSQLKFLQGDVEEKLHMTGVQVKRIEVDGLMQTCYSGMRLKEKIRQLKLAD